MLSVNLFTTGGIEMTSKQKQNYQIKPLMYIVQPDNQDINVHMQSFVVKKVRSKAVVGTESVDSGAKTIENESILNEKTVEEIPEEIKSNKDVKSVQKIPEEIKSNKDVKSVQKIPEEIKSNKDVKSVQKIPEEIKSNEDVQSVQEIQDNQVEQRQEQSVKEYRKQRKPLTKMNVAEKVEFFTNLPKNMPRTLCQIETTDEDYRGVIMSEEDGIVTIRSLTHAKPINLPVANIIAINLLGF